MGKGGKLRKAYAGGAFRAARRVGKGGTLREAEVGMVNLVDFFLKETNVRFFKAGARELKTDQRNGGRIRPHARIAHTWLI
ncbi:MAG: hypothetical protein ABW189_06750 [Rickettsiales bacterium]